MFVTEIIMERNLLDTQMFSLFIHVIFIIMQLVIFINVINCQSLLYQYNLICSIYYSKECKDLI